MRGRQVFANIRDNHVGQRLTGRTTTRTLCTVTVHIFALLGFTGFTFCRLGGS